ncbi:MAG: hypothetical protein B0D91_03500 [Oceanospirillales bacterium LUC14_002_19_P2]|nr:MAG: hypothetical protein B0D91_03500 [Oceanospirillales bacterium LUC14_002_19_P2]
MGKVRSTGAGGASGGLHQINDAKGKSKVSKARIGGLSVSVSKVKGKKTSFGKGLSKLVNKLKVHKRSVHQSVDVASKKFGAKTAEVLHERNQHVSAFQQAETRAEKSMELASESSLRQDTALEAERLLATLTQVMTDQRFSPDILANMQSIRDQIATHKTDDAQRHTDASKQAEDALGEMKGLETQLAADTSSVKTAFETDHKEKVNELVNAKFEKAKAAASKTEGQIKTKRDAFGKKKTENREALEQQNEKIRQFYGKKATVNVALDTAKTVQKETNKYFGMLEVLSKGLKFLEGMDVGPAPDPNLSQVLSELHPDGDAVSAEDAVSAAEDNVNSLSKQLGVKMEKATAKQATYRQRLETAKANVEQLIKEAKEQVETLDTQRKDLVKEEKKLQKEIQKERSALAIALKGMSKALDGELENVNTEFRGQKRALKENIPGFDVAKAPKKGRFTQAVKTQISQESSQKSAVTQESGQEMVEYAQVSKPFGTGARYENVDAMSDDSGIHDDFRDDDFDDDFNDDAEFDNGRGEQSASAPPLSPRNYGATSTDANYVQQEPMTIDMLSQNLLAYFDNGRDTLDEVFRSETLSDAETAAYLDRLVSDVAQGLMGSKVIFDQQVAWNAADRLVESEGRDIDTIKRILNAAAKEGRNSP